jgi:hypothetical protein
MKHLTNQTAADLLNIVTNGHPADASFNEQLWAENAIADGMTYASAADVKQAFAAWSRQHDEA